MYVVMFACMSVSPCAYLVLYAKEIMAPYDEFIFNILLEVYLVREVVCDAKDIYSIETLGSEVIIVIAI